MCVFMNLVSGFMSNIVIMFILFSVYNMYNIILINANKRITRFNCRVSMKCFKFIGSLFLGNFNLCVNFCFIIVCI